MKTKELFNCHSLTANQFQELTGVELNTDCEIQISLECIQDLNSYFKYIFRVDSSEISDSEWQDYEHFEEVLNNLDMKNARKRCVLI